jgi:hypothetical protein
MLGRLGLIHDACMSLAFPDYREETLSALLGSVEPENSETKIWRVIFPEKFKLIHILIRADSFPQAYASACDYACRMSLRMFKKIPSDLTIRVIFMSEKAIRRHLDMRWANRVNRRKKLQLDSREFTDRQISGARLCALGLPTGRDYGIIKYTETQDLRMIKLKKNRSRKSVIEHESFKSDD